MPAGRETKTVILYERDGAVYRRVEKELGGGAPVVTSDMLYHPDIKEFTDQNPNAQIQGYHPEQDIAVPNPENFTLRELPDFLQDIDSVDVLFRLRELDTRKTADEMYRERIQQVVTAELAEDDNDDEEEEETEENQVA